MKYRIWNILETHFRYFLPLILVRNLTLSFLFLNRNIKPEPVTQMETRYVLIFVDVMFKYLKYSHFTKLDSKHLMKNRKKIFP